MSKIEYIKKPAILYGGFLVAGIMLGVFVLNPTFGETHDLSSQSVSNFKSIFFTNGGIVLLIYLSCIFTRIYAYLTYSVNGLIHGIYFGWIIKTNIALMFLVIPHGIFEIICILASGYIVSKGETYIRNNFKKFITLLFFHELAILLCAVIEAFITPCFAKYI